MSKIGNIRSRINPMRIGSKEIRNKVTSGAILPLAVAGGYLGAKSLDKKRVKKTATELDFYKELIYKEASEAHPGFQAVANKIAAKQGISKERAGAILASSARHASPAAKRANPKLRKVK